MKSIITLIFIATVSLATPAAAIDEKGRWFAQGAASCGKWLDIERRDGGRNSWERISQLSWLAGFVAGANAHRFGRMNYLESTDLPSAMLWIDKYCTENPLSDSGAAAFALIKELAGRQP